MQQGNFSWIVHPSAAIGGNPIQINAMRVEVESSGALTFYIVSSTGSEYASHILSPGSWHYATIMSQMTGEENGWEPTGTFEEKWKVPAPSR
jgi:hypothetical protein